MKPIEVVFPSDFSTSNLTRVHELCGQVWTCVQSGVALDLSSVKRFTPFSACYFGSLVDSLIRRGCSVVIESPKNISAKHQVEYLGVKSYFTGKPLPASPLVSAVAMRHLVKPDYDVAFRMAALTRDTFKLSDAHFYLISICLKELLQNAFEHSESDSGVYVCAYGVKNRQVVRLCALDGGIGIRRHLMRNPRFEMIESDGEALVKAMKPGVSGEPKRSRGLGLYYIRRLLHDIGGELVISSGDAIVSVVPPNAEQVKPLSYPYSGTIVSIKFHANKNFRFRLDDYEVS